MSNPYLDLIDAFSTCPFCKTGVWERNSGFYGCGTPRSLITKKEYFPSKWDFLPWVKPKFIDIKTEHQRSQYCESLEFAFKVDKANNLIKSYK